MPKIQVNVSAEDTLIGFPIVEPGTYECMISKVEIGTSKSGNQMATLKLTPQGKVPCRVVDEAGETKQVQVEGRELLKTQCVFQANCARQTLQLQVATKMPGIGFKHANGVGEFDPDEYIQFQGKLVKAVVENEDYEGRPQAKVKSLYPVS